MDNAVVASRSADEDAPDVRPSVESEVIPAGAVAVSDESGREIGMGPMLTAHAKSGVAVTSAMVVAEMRHGEEALLNRIADDMLAGCDYSGVARWLGVGTGELARWIFATPEREAAYRGILRIKADMQAHEAIRIAKDASVDTVPLAKLQIDTLKWTMSRWDRKTYGDDKGGVTVGVGVSFVVSKDDVGML